MTLKRRQEKGKKRKERECVCVRERKRKRKRKREKERERESRPIKKIANSYHIQIRFSFIPSLTPLLPPSHLSHSLYHWPTLAPLIASWINFLSIFYHSYHPLYPTFGARRRLHACAPFHVRPYGDGPGAPWQPWQRRGEERMHALSNRWSPAALRSQRDKNLLS